MTTYEFKTEHPWQSGPAELIAHGIEHMHKNTDFDLRIGFLSLDVGVETLLKTILLLPGEITSAKTNYEDRKKAAKGNSFNAIIQAMKLARPDIAKKYNLEHIQYYHDKRNQLYHEGNGITVDIHKTQEYAKLAVHLLRDLLDIDLEPLLLLPEIKLREIEKRKEEQKVFAAKNIEAIYLAHTLEDLARSVVEIYSPTLTSNAFFRKLEHFYKSSVPDAENCLAQVFTEAFPNWTINEIIKKHYLNVESLLNDRDVFYLTIIQDVLGFEGPYSVHSALNMRPEEFLSTMESVYDKNRDSHYEFVRTEAELYDKIIKYYDDGIRQGKDAILILQNWLDNHDSSPT